MWTQFVTEIQYTYSGKILSKTSFNLSINIERENIMVYSQGKHDTMNSEMIFIITTACLLGSDHL